jgi:peptide/nickel transport system permease protein
MLEVVNAPFVEAARGHGIGRPRLLLRYALPAAANPLISLFGFSVGGLLSASLLVEVITGWPGLGPLLLEATMSRDLYVVLGVVMVSTSFMVFGNLFADILLVVVDPRVRME